MPRQNSTIQELFDEAIEFEKKASEFYAEFASAFNGTSDIARFWVKMKEDELFHAKLLYDICARLTPQQLSTPADKDMWDKVMSVHQSFSYASAAPLNNLNDAYLISHDIENSELNAIFRFLTIDNVPFANRKELIESYLSYHIDNLRQFGEQFRREIRETIPVR